MSSLTGAKCPAFAATWSGVSPLEFCFSRRDGRSLLISTAKSVCFACKAMWRAVFLLGVDPSSASGAKLFTSVTLPDFAHLNKSGSMGVDIVDRIPLFFLVWRVNRVWCSESFTARLICPGPITPPVLFETFHSSPRQWEKNNRQPLGDERNASGLTKQGGRRKDQQDFLIKATLLFPFLLIYQSYYRTLGDASVQWIERSSVKLQLQ